MTAKPLKREQQELLDWLTAVANEGGPCPNNDEIADRFNRQSTSSASNMVRALAHAGHVVVESFGQSRMVTIVATGKHTKRPRDAKPHWTVQRAARAAIAGRASDQSDGAEAEGPAPFPTMDELASQDELLPRAIRLEAQRRGKRLAGFLSELVALGWATYLEDLREEAA